MKEVFFLVECGAEGGYVARALGESIVTEANDLDSLRTEVRGAVRCRFKDAQTPQVISPAFYTWGDNLGMKLQEICRVEGKQWRSSQLSQARAYAAALRAIQMLWRAVLGSTRK